MTVEYPYSIKPTDRGNYIVKPIGAGIPNICSVFNSMVIDYFKIPSENIPDVLETSKHLTEMALTEILLHFANEVEFKEPVVINFVANDEGSIVALGLISELPEDTYVLVNPYLGDMTAFATVLAVKIYQHLRYAIQESLWYKTGYAK